MSKANDFFNALNLSPPGSTERSYIQVVQGPAGIQGDSGVDGYALYYGPTAPTSGLFDGLMWFKTDSGKSYLYLTTENGAQFVDAFGSGISITSGSEIDFPTGPITGDNYTFASRTWQWSGSAWDYISSTTITIGLTAPDTIYGNFWYDMSGSALLLGIKDIDGNDTFVEI